MPRTRNRRFTPAQDAIQFRSLAFGIDEWQRTKAAAHGRGLAVRKFVAAAIDAELAPLLKSLGAGGPSPRRSHRRLPMDERVLKQLSAGRKRAGIPAVALLRLCVAQHAAKCAETPADGLAATSTAPAITT